MLNMTSHASHLNSALGEVFEFYTFDKYPLIEDFEETVLYTKRLLSTKRQVVKLEKRDFITVCFKVTRGENIKL